MGLYREKRDYGISWDEPILGSEEFKKMDRDYHAAEAIGAVDYTYDLKLSYQDVPRIGGCHVGHIETFVNGTRVLQEGYFDINQTSTGNEIVPRKNGYTIYRITTKSKEGDLVHSIIFHNLKSGKLFLLSNKSHEVEDKNNFRDLPRDLQIHVINHKNYLISCYPSIFGSDSTENQPQQ